MLTVILIGVICLIILILLRIRSQLYFWEKKGVPSLKSWTEYKYFILSFFNRVCFADVIVQQYNALPNKTVHGVCIFNIPMLNIKDPDLLRLIMIKDFEHFTDHVDAFITEETDSFFGKNLFQLKGQRWHAMRTTLSPAFTGSKMRNMFALMTECGEQLVQYFDRKFKQNDGKLLETEFLDVCTKFTNDVITTVALGIKVDSLENPNNQFYKIGQTVQNFPIWRFLFVSYFPRFAKFINLKFMPNWIYDFFRNTIKETIETRERENIIRPDMIHILTEARKGKLKFETSTEKSEEFAIIDETEVAKPSFDKLVLTEEDIVAQAFIFFIAGFGNVAITMAWASYELALNPEIQNKLYDEIKQSLDENNGKLTYDILMKMKYLDLVVTETLRKWPPVTQTQRQVTKPYKLKTDGGEIDLPNGSYISIPIIGIHRDPKYYLNPEKFEPERFTDQSKINPFTYLPFGNGPRICIGSRLTLLEVKVFLVYMLSKYKFIVIGKTPIPPVLKNGGTLELKDGFWMGLERRS